MTDPTKLAEAQKLIEIWNIEKGDTMGGYVYINPVYVEGVDKLLAAQSLLSYERGREEGEIKERMRCNDILHEVYMKKKKIHQLDFIDEIQGKILNPTSDAK